ncbi:MAG: MarR family transcriptional regulator [Coriobacteriales bacterium]|jgi:DNA-binding MarR family transcriptional regulator|nr:MarR family transcriptional regulator [Coriobacteriales bacterium]
MAEPEQMTEKETTNRWQTLLATLLPVDKPVRILAIGFDESCLSWLAEQLVEAGHRVAKMDLQHTLANQAVEDSFVFDQRDKSFDAIVWHGLTADLAIAQSMHDEVFRVLKKNGHLIVFDTPGITVSQLLAKGYSHCHEVKVEGLTMPACQQKLRVFSARIPSHHETEGIAQVALLNRHLQTSKRLILLYQNWCKTAGVSYPEFTVMNFVSRHTKGAKPSDISNALVIAPQTLTRILNDLEAVGLISRAIDDRDRRSSVITLSADGLAKIKPLQKALREIEETAFAGFAIADMAKLGDLSDELLMTLDAAFGEADE